MTRSTADFVSEPIAPAGGAFDTAAMARGEPGLPNAFTWRGTTYRVAGVEARWKDTSPEGGRAGGEVYLRRHCFELRMHDGQKWVVYFVRQNPRSGNRGARWYLYQVEYDAAGVPV